MLTALILIAMTPKYEPDWKPVFDRLQITAQDLALPQGRWRGGGLYALDTFNRYWDNWDQVEPSVGAFAERSLKDRQTPQKNINRCLEYLGFQSPSQKKREKGLSFVDSVIACGGTKPERVAELKILAKRVPSDVAQAASRILSSCVKAAQLRKEVFSAISDPIDSYLGEAESFAIGFSLGAHKQDLIEKTNYAKLAEAANLVADTLYTTNLRSAHTKFSFEWKTDLGKIVIKGDGDNTTSLDGTLLSMDTGGSDTYKGGRSPSGCQVILDPTGKDRYENCGYALCSISEILDQSGDDTYLAQSPGNAAAGFGVSILVDQKGNDIYQCTDFGDGAATCGIALLSDEQGNDIYKGHCLSQGYGGVRGFGLLLDAKGNDTYEADDTKIDNPSPQTAEHNTSLSQGCGFGRRADGSDGISMAGGFGFLVDGEGNDTYKSGVFGQGVGYWYACGALVDFGGNDSYKGVWYVQGSAAHYAIGSLLDLGGNDQYEAIMHQSIGQGHDYSIGILHDVGGDNTYLGRGGGLFGTGRWNGLGIFRADGGKNTFTTTAGDTFGFVGDFRQGESCNGIFYVTGDVVFDKTPRGKPNDLWIQQNPRVKGILGAGLSIVKSQPSRKRS